MSLPVWFRILIAKREIISSVLVGLVLFIAGWHLGRTTSPWYAAHPIVFEDNTIEELVELKEQGVAQRQPDPQKKEESQQVAGATDQGRGLFVGSINSDKFHHLNCSTWKRIKEENQVWFASREEAEAAGYTPTTCTQDFLN